MLKDVYDADLAVHPQSAMAQYKRELLAAILTRLTQVCEAGGVPLVCVVVPSPVDLDPDFRIRVDRSLFPNYDPRGLTNACAGAARSAGIEVRDLYDLFAANDPSQIFVGAEATNPGRFSRSLSIRQNPSYASYCLGNSPGLGRVRCLYFPFLLSTFPLSTSLLSTLSYSVTCPGTFQSLSRAWPLTGPVRQNWIPGRRPFGYNPSFFVSGPKSCCFWCLPKRHQKTTIFRQGPK